MYASIELDRRERRGRRRLEDDGVAGDQRGAASGRPTSAIGKLNGLMTAKTPCGRRIGPGVDGRVAEVAHRVVEAVVVLHRRRVVADAGRPPPRPRRAPRAGSCRPRSPSAAAYSIWRSLMRSPARLMIATRSRQGVAAQAGLGGPGGRDRVVDVAGACPWRTCRARCPCRSASGPRTPRRRRATRPPT